MPPTRTPQQRADALVKAMAARQARAQLKADLASGRVTAVDVITGSADHAEWAALQVSWLLRSLPGFGAVKSARLMEEVGISPTRRIQGLGDRQRACLLEELKGR